MIELAQQFFPPGVVQVLSGDDTLGPWLTEHPDVAKVSFTGSTATGIKVLQSSASSLKRVTLELYIQPGLTATFFGKLIILQRRQRSSNHLLRC